jgi:H+/Cl- antiporter ClcA
MSSIMLALGGGAIGREGPTIQISASIFRKINDLLPDWYPRISRKNMIISGAAAGLASAFNTPLGGIVFAIEELTKTHLNFFKSALLTAVIIACLTALNFLGPYLYIGYPNIQNVSFWIIFGVIPVAIISGLGGSGLGKLILIVFRKKRKLKKNYQHILYVLICGLILAILAVFIDERIMGSGRELMQSLLFTDQKQQEWYVPILRVIGPLISFTTGASGGIFAPSLSAGASIGAFISDLLHLTETETNLMILCGMVGFLTGITRSPFTSSILVLEMTNDHNIIFHLMFTALTASLIANTFGKKSLYDNLKDQYLSEVSSPRKIKEQDD